MVNETEERKSLLNRLIGRGRIPEKHKELCASLLRYLERHEGHIIDLRGERHTPFEALKILLDGETVERVDHVDHAEGRTTSDKIINLAQKISENEGLSFSEAIKEANRRRPDLSDQYRKGSGIKGL